MHVRPSARRGAAWSRGRNLRPLRQPTRAWGIGVGSALLADALRHLDRGFSVTVVWVLSQNPRARACYERAGFTTVADGIEHAAHPEAPLCLMRREARGGSA